MNRHVNLTKRIRTSKGLRYCPVVVAANGRVKPDYVVVGDREERHTEGAYYLEWYEGGKRLRRSVGRDAATAAARRHQQEQILASKAAGIRLVEEGGTDGPLLGDAVAAYRMRSPCFSSSDSAIREQRRGRALTSPGQDLVPVRSQARSGRSSCHRKPPVQTTWTVFRRRKVFPLLTGYSRQAASEHPPWKRSTQTSAGARNRRKIWSRAQALPSPPREVGLTSIARPRVRNRVINSRRDEWAGKLTWNRGLCWLANARNCFEMRRRRRIGVTWLAGRLLPDSSGFACCRS